MKGDVNMLFTNADLPMTVIENWRLEVPNPPQIQIFSPMFAGGSGEGQMIRVYANIDTIDTIARLLVINVNLRFAMSKSMSQGIFSCETKDLRVAESNENWSTNMSVHLAQAGKVSGNP